MTRTEKRPKWAGGTTDVALVARLGFSGKFTNHKRLQTLTNPFET